MEPKFGFLFALFGTLLSLAHFLDTPLRIFAYPQRIFA